MSGADSSNPMYIVIKRQKIIVACAVIAIFFFCSGMSRASPSRETRSDKSSFLIGLTPILSSVDIDSPYGKGPDKKALDYLHCGMKLNSATMGKDDVEFVLLHGARFTKNDWLKSGILKDLCEEGRSHISVVALDLSVRADGAGFTDAFQALVKEGTLSGNPVVVISPSASGKSIVSLASNASKDSKIKKSLQNMIKIWIPVAAGSVLSVKENDTLEVFSELAIKVLAIHGDKDVMGKKVTQKLEKSSGATGVELSGGHPVYLDSPKEFVDVIMKFVRNGEEVQS